MLSILPAWEVVNSKFGQFQNCCKVGGAGGRALCRGSGWPQFSPYLSVGGGEKQTLQQPCGQFIASYAARNAAHSLRSSKRTVCKYLSAALGKIVTITLPRLCSLLASCRATHATAPLLIPTERPSSSIRRIAVATASSSVTGTTASIRSILSVSG